MHQSVRPDGFAGTNSYYTQLAGKVNNPAGGPGSEASGSPLSVIQIFTDKKRAPCLLRGYSALFFTCRSTYDRFFISYLLDACR